jgi:hypothetical protein
VLHTKATANLRTSSKTTCFPYGDPPPAEAIERMDMELGAIDRMGFNAYFMIVWDFVRYAKSNGAAAAGRGAARGVHRLKAIPPYDADDDRELRLRRCATWAPRSTPRTPC